MGGWLVSSRRTLRVLSAITIPPGGRLAENAALRDRLTFYATKAGGHKTRHVGSRGTSPDRLRERLELWGGNRSLSPPFQGRAQ